MARCPSCGALYPESNKAFFGDQPPALHKQIHAAKTRVGKNVKIFRRVGCLCEGIASQSLNMYPCFARGPDNSGVLRRAAVALSHEILQFHTRENGSSLDNGKALALLFFTTRGTSSKQHLMLPQSPLLVHRTNGSRHTARAINAHWEYVPAVARSGEEAQRLCNHASIGRLTIARCWHCSLHRPRSILQAA